jgi:hypothetical protein
MFTIMRKRPRYKVDIDAIGIELQQKTPTTKIK